MKCPKCSRKMEFDHDIKDYFCDNCNVTLKYLKRGEKQKEPSRDEKEMDEENGEEKTPEKVDIYSQPGAGTVKGIMFMMIGSLIIILTPVLRYVCELFSVIGLFLLIMGFFLVYQDRKSQNKEHELFMKYALIFFILWLIIYILINIYSISFGNDITNELDKFEDKDIVPTKLIIDYLENIKIISIFSFPALVILATFRFLTIKSLIKKNLYKVLIISLVLIMISGFISWYFTLDFYNTTINNLENTTKEEFINLDFNTTSGEDYIGDRELFFNGLTFLNITAEALMLSCYFWTWRSRKDEFTN